MAWVILGISGVLECVWVAFMKASNGFTHLGFTIAMFVTAGLGFWLLGWAMKSLPLGTAYPIWVGIGAIGTFVIGILYFNEPFTALRGVSIALILIGIAGLKAAA
jgi:quaternary ammonium compound-resistance protein SugE